MAANSATSVVDLDHETIKQNLITFLQSQDNIQDYDYAGSNMNTLLDVLAYNSFMQNFYLQTVSNEMFLDTAQIRDSIISHVKELNYVPRSSQGALAYIDVKVVPTDTPSSINMDKYTLFSSTIGGATCTFSTEEDIIIQPSTDNTGNTVYLASNVAIYEGDLTTEYFNVNTTNNFIIELSNEDSDIRHLTVSVQESNTSSIVNVWSKATTLFGMTDTSTSYFIEPARSDKYNITFGDGIFGLKPSVGNVIAVTYRVVKKAAGDNGKVFTASQSIDGYSNVVVTTVTNSTGGSDIESLAEIKRSAPKAFQVQERAVTSSDYEILVKQQFPDVENVLAFGGEELTPPKFGKVILAVDLIDADGVSDSKKIDIANYLSSRTPVSVDVEVISPDFIFIDTTMTVSYNVAVTTDSAATIKSKALNALVAYANTEINKFNAVWRNSKATAAVDAADTSIISTQLANRPYIKLALSSILKSYKLDFNNTLKPDSTLTTSTRTDLYEPALESSLFTYGTSDVAYFIDDGVGNISIVRSDIGSTYTVLKAVAGTVDYTTGVVNILPILISTYIGTTVKIYAQTDSRDIRTSKQSILQLNDEDVTVTTVQERI